MKTTKIQISPDKRQDGLRNILGINNSTQLNNHYQLPHRKKLFDELGAKFVRHHDAVGENPGYALIDVSRIFPLFHADINDPKNYIFGPTDDYLRMLPEDMIIEFRFGEQIEHSTNFYRVLPPADYERWTDICVNIMRHLTEGWADGLHLNIQYLSFYEEPNDGFDRIFAGPFDEFLKLYLIGYKKMKKAFPHMKVGGPTTGYNYDTEAVERFLTFCQQNDIKPDFVSGDIYSRSLDRIPDKVREIEQVLERYNYQDVEIFVTEWHIGPLAWRPPNYRGFFDAEGAAYSASVLIRLIDTNITGAYFYSWGGATFGIVHRDEETGLAAGYPTYYALKNFAQLTKCESRICVTPDEKDDAVDMLAGITAEGKVQLLLSCYNAELRDFEITVPGYSAARLKKIVNSAPKEEETWLPMEKNGDAFTVSLEGDGCAVYFVEFEK